jgi:hypothetical protein
MEINCPQCNSNQVQKLSLVYAQNVSRVSGNTSRSSFNGTAITGVGQKSAPPLTPVAVITIAVGIVPFFALLGSFLLLIIFRQLGGIILVLGIPAGLIYLIQWVIRSIRNYPSRKAQWNKMFMCQRCGHVFEFEL